jgi:transposase InsO family protein
VGHPNEEGVKGLTKAVDGITLLDGDIPFCDPCVMGKITRLPFPKKTENRATAPLGRIHTDIACPSEKGYRDTKYFITFIDDFSRYAYVYTMKKRSEAVEKFKHFKALVENQHNTSIKILRSDNAPEYTEGEFQKVLSDAGIHHETTTPHSPQQNGVAERYNRTLGEMARTMIFDANLSSFFWPFAVKCANHLKNRITHSSLPPNKTPYELFTGTRPNLSYLHPFGAPCFSKILGQVSKFAPRAEPGLFLGYANGAKAYIFWSNRSKSHYTRRDLVFPKTTGIEQKGTGEEPSYDVYTPLFENPLQEALEGEIR